MIFNRAWLGGWLLAMAVWNVSQWLTSGTPPFMAALFGALGALLTLDGWLRQRTLERAMDRMGEILRSDGEGS